MNLTGSFQGNQKHTAQTLQSDSQPNGTYEPVLRSAILFSKYFFSKSAKRIVNEQSTSFSLASIKWTEFSKMLHWLLQKCILKHTKKIAGL